MKTVSDLLREVKSEAGMKQLVQLYGHREGELAHQLERYMLLLKRHVELYGEESAPMILSAPGRTELCGNHTDHNNGCVLAAAVNLDTIAAVAPRADQRVKLFSEGFGALEMDLSDLAPVPSEEGTTAALIRGVAARMQQMGLRVGGFEATVMSDVLSGSGLSSSAAFEVLMVAVLDALYNGMCVSPIERAKISQYAENAYFGKPCGLMDQMACSVGGLVAIDFKKDEPVVTPMQLDLTGAGYSLVVVNTGGSHDDLTQDYAAIRAEMGKVAACFGEKTLRMVLPEQLWQELPRVKKEAGDRAVLRAIHYYEENARVKALVKAVEQQNINAFKDILTASGRSSWMYLQNVYANAQTQPLCVALGLAEHLLSGTGAWRVHGGGFAGTTLNVVPLHAEARFVKKMNALFGDHACHVLSIRPVGAQVVFDCK